MKKDLPANYDKLQEYSLEEAVALLPQLSTSKFTGSVDVDILFAFNDKQKKESVRGSVTLPHKFGDEKSVLVFAEETDQKAAKDAGADIVGLEELVAKVESGEVTADVIIATPTVMPKIAKLGRVLGPKGLMPNPNNETVTTDFERVIQGYKSGKQDFKMTDQGAVRAKVAKLDMTAEAIAENITAFITAVATEAKKVRPAPVKRITLAPTMGKGVRVETSSYNS